MTPEGIDAFLRLFRGRGDCYGSWDGSCVRQPLTRRQFEQHLTTGPYIGTYPLMGDKASWGCIDIDGKDHAIDYDAKLWDWDAMTVIAVNLRTVLAVKGVKLWLERTVNGIHCWVFPSTPLINAADMRRCLMAACAVIGYNPKEVNPKSESLPAEKVGNYVRLPYPGGEYATERLFLDAGFGEQFAEYTLDEMFECIDRVGRSSASAIAAVAKLWTPPVVQTHSFDEAAGMDVQNLLPLLGGLSYTIWRDGALDGNDRSGTLIHLAHLLVEDGLTPAGVLAVLISADQRMGGKFTSRGEKGLEYLQDMADRAFAKKGR